MNIFITDNDPIAAANLVDKHVVKMPLETAQILCTVARSKGYESVYRSTHARHPATLWAARSSANWNWLCLHGLALSREYTRRYNRIHKCQAVIQNLHDLTNTIWSESLDFTKHTPFEQCMPDQYKNPDPVIAYRSYYIGEKARFATWKYPAKKPEWFTL